MTIEWVMRQEAQKDNDRPSSCSFVVGTGAIKREQFDMMSLHERRQPTDMIAISRLLVLARLPWRIPKKHSRTQATLCFGRGPRPV